MPPAQPAPPPRPGFVPWVVYAALVIATGFYLLVLVMQAESLSSIDPDPVMLPVLGATALSTAVASVLLPRYLHRVALSSLKLETEEVPDPSSSVMFRDKTPTIRVFADPEGARRRAYAIFFTPFIIRLALTESIAIYGFVIGMQGFGWEAVLPFFGVAWVLFALSAPLEARALGPVEEALDARFPEG